MPACRFSRPGRVDRCRGAEQRPDGGCVCTEKRLQWRVPVRRVASGRCVGGDRVVGSSRASPPGLGELPAQPGALVGRAADLSLLRDLLLARETRMVTLTGPPGVGKTRLALAAAAELGPHFADGVVFVDLTAVRDPALVPGELLGCLGLDRAGPSDAPGHLARALAGRDLLVVVDNCEHVLGAGPALAAVGAVSARLRMLVTSRERLHLRVERELAVHPLGLPRAGDDPERVAAAPAVALLVQSVRSADPAFGVTAENRASLAEICVRLDGLPLALELAAARLRLFTPGELTFRLRHRMTVLTGGAHDLPERHRTLRAALSWSHDLLTPRERALFRRFSVFVGGATLDAVEQVCGDHDTVEVIGSLVDKNLLRRRTRPGDVAEFAMLESLREFAAELLAAGADEGPTRRRHARYYAGRAMLAEARVGSEGETAALAEIGVERGNLRAAMACSAAAGELAESLQLAAALGWYSYTHGRLGEGRAMVDGVLAAADGATGAVPEGPLTAALTISAVLAVARGEYERAEEQLRRCGDLTERAADLRHTAIAGAFRGHLARARGEYDEAVIHHERAAALHGRLGSAHGVAWSGYDLGLLERRRGRLDAAARHLRSVLPRFRDATYPWAVACTAWALATVELGRGRPDDAASLLVEAIEGCVATDDGRLLASCLEAVAALACGRRAPDDAARLLGAASALRDRLAAPRPEEDRADHDAVVRRVRRDLGVDAADRARCAGRRLSPAEAVDLAHRTLASPPHRVLTAREQQVADLVARGRTNRQIGRTLGIAEKTAEVHVHNIIRKLDASSRAEVAAWVGAGGGRIPEAPPDPALVDHR